MGKKEKLAYEKAANLCVTPERYGSLVLRRIHLQPSQAPGDTLGANILSLFPDAPEAIMYYFPGHDRDAGA